MQLPCIMYVLTLMKIFERRYKTYYLQKYSNTTIVKLKTLYNVRMLHNNKMDWPPDSKSTERY